MPNVNVDVTTNPGTPIVQLQSGIITTVTFNADLSHVEVITAGATTADIWWTCDGSTPSAGVGYFIPSGSLGTDRRDPTTASNTVVSLYSAGTPSVRVQRGD